jgi:hypothetical protein
MISPLGTTALASIVEQIPYLVVTSDEVVSVVDAVRSDITIEVEEVGTVVETVNSDMTVQNDEVFAIEDRTRGIDKNGMDIISWRRTDKTTGGIWNPTNKNY